MRLNKQIKTPIHYAALTTIKMKRDNKIATNAGKIFFTKTFDALVGSLFIITPPYLIKSCQ